MLAGLLKGATTVTLLGVVKTISFFVDLEGELLFGTAVPFVPFDLSTKEELPSFPFRINNPGN